MKKTLLCLLLLVIVGFDSHKDSAYSVGEWFKFRIHYGFVNAGYATLEVKEAAINNKKVFHVLGKGYTTGMTRFIFKVEDLYETYIDPETGNPYRFVRKINEGGYKKDQEGFFNQEANSVLVKDYKNKSENTFEIPKNTQDILSAFYYLRNSPQIEKIKPGETIALDMFFDNETTKFKLKFVGRENINTKFGKLSALIFKPLVQSGRVFKEKESLTVWVTDDDNKLPIRIEADLAIGSLKADLDAFNGIKTPLKIKK